MACPPSEEQHSVDASGAPCPRSASSLTGLMTIVTGRDVDQFAALKRYIIQEARRPNIVGVCLGVSWVVVPSRLKPYGDRCGLLDIFFSRALEEETSGDFSDRHRNVNLCG